MTIVKKITYKLKFIHSYRFMNSKFSDLVDNLSDINKKECPECMRKKIKSECEFIGFKMIDYITDVKNVKKDVLSQKMD